MALKSVVKREHEDGVIARWQEAYEAANGRSAPRVLRWGNGWFQIADGTSSRRRLKDLEDYTDRLVERAERENPSKSSEV